MHNLNWHRNWLFRLLVMLFRCHFFALNLRDRRNRQQAERSWGYFVVGMPSFQDEKNPTPNRTRRTYETFLQVWTIFIKPRRISELHSYMTVPFWHDSRMYACDTETLTKAWQKHLRTWMVRFCHHTFGSLIF
jgi:hypothetical protein